MIPTDVVLCYLRYPKKLNECRHETAESSGAGVIHPQHPQQHQQRKVASCELYVPPVRFVPPFDSGLIWGATSELLAAVRCMQAGSSTTQVGHMRPRDATHSDKESICPCDTPLCFIINNNSHHHRRRRTSPIYKRATKA